MHERYCQAYVLYGTVTTVCPQAVCPQLLFALNYCSPQLCLRYDYDYDWSYSGQQVYEGAGFGQFQQQMARDQRF